MDLTTAYITAGIISALSDAQQALPDICNEVIRSAKSSKVQDIINWTVFGFLGFILAVIMASIMIEMNATKSAIMYFVVWVSIGGLIMYWIQQHDYDESYVRAVERLDRKQQEAGCQIKQERIDKINRIIDALDAQLNKNKE